MIIRHADDIPPRARLTLGETRIASEAFKKDFGFYVTFDFCRL